MVCFALFGLCCFLFFKQRARPFFCRNAVSFRNILTGEPKPCQDTLNAVNTKLGHSARKSASLLLTPVNPHLLIASHAFTLRLLGCTLTLLLGLQALAQTPVRKISQHFLPIQPIYDVWGYTDMVNTRTLDTHVKRLREKLGERSACLVTVRGAGYRFSVRPS